MMKTTGPSGLHESIYCFSCNAFIADFFGEEVFAENALIIWHRSWKTFLPWMQVKDHSWGKIIILEGGSHILSCVLCEVVLNQNPCSSRIKGLRVKDCNCYNLNPEILRHKGAKWAKPVWLFPQSIKEWFSVRKFYTINIPTMLSLKQEFFEWLHRH